MVRGECCILCVMEKHTRAEPPTPSTSRKHICLPFESEEHYDQCVADHRQFREYLNGQIAARPELFPEAVNVGYTFHDKYQSRKLKLTLRRIKLKQNREVFTIRPSFVLPYCVARTDKIEKALYLRLWGVPFTALAYVFGRNEMFWDRAWIALGRANLVGATVKSEAAMPGHLIVDEKITWVDGQEVSVPTTASGGCFLGITVSERDNTEGLQAAYGEFAQEAKAVFPTYRPNSVCTDGWAATREAWRLLFPQITLVLCYLHSVIKIAARCTGQFRQEVLTRVWHVYHAETKSEFSQRLRRLEQWSAKRPEWRRRRNGQEALPTPSRIHAGLRLPASGAHLEWSGPLAQSFGSVVVCRLLRPLDAGKFALGRSGDSLAMELSSIRQATA